MLRNIWILPCAALLASGLALAGGGAPDHDDDSSDGDETTLQFDAQELAEMASKMAQEAASGVKLLFSGDGGDATWLTTDALQARRGFLGVSLTDLTPELRTHFGVAEDEGILIGRVEKDSPADKAGLKVGDILLEVDGEKMESSSDVGRIIREKEEGDTVDLGIQRDGRIMTLAATIAERERAQYEVSRILSGLRAGDKDRPFVFRFDPDTVNDAVKRFRFYANDKDLQERLQRFHGLDEDLRQRMEELEERLHELERELEKKRK